MRYLLVTLFAILLFVLVGTVSNPNARRAALKNFWYKWHLGLPRIIREYLRPPHIICPYSVKHLTEEQWKNHAQAWVDWGKEYENLPGELWQAHNVHKKSWKEAGSNIPFTVSEWLEKEGLPPISPIDYDPVNETWVDDMPQAQRKAYLRSLDW
jgi:hypothetical protein